MACPPGTSDPRIDFGTKSCVRGDPFLWVMKVKAQGSDPNVPPDPVNLADYGTWTGDCRLEPDRTVFYPLGVDVQDGDATDDEFVMTLTADQTRTMGAGIFGFDLEASIGGTIFKGEIDIYADYTRVG